MADADTDGRKRQRETRPDVSDVMHYARITWRQNDPLKPMAASTEVRDFREFFGCLPSIFLALWNLLYTVGYLPEGGTIEHLLWTLMFMKIYPKRKQMSVLCDGADKDTWSKWVFTFLDAIAYLEPHVVSVVVSLIVLTFFLLLCFINLIAINLPDNMGKPIQRRQGRRLPRHSGWH